MLSAKALRKICPELAHLSDEDLGRRYHAGRYKDMLYEEFVEKFRRVSGKGQARESRAKEGRSGNGMDYGTHQALLENGYGYDKSQNWYFKWGKDEEGKVSCDYTQPLKREVLEAIMQKQAAGKADPLGIRGQASQETAKFPIRQGMPDSEWRDNFYGRGRGDLSATVESADFDEQVEQVLGENYVGDFIESRRSGLKAPDADEVLSGARLRSNNMRAGQEAVAKGAGVLKGLPEVQKAVEPKVARGASPGERALATGEEVKEAKARGKESVLKGNDWLFR